MHNVYVRLLTHACLFMCSYMWTDKGMMERRKRESGGMGGVEGEGRGRSTDNVEGAALQCSELA